MLHSTSFITLVLANRCFFLCLNLDVLSSDISVLNLVGRMNGLFSLAVQATKIVVVKILR